MMGILRDRADTIATVATTSGVLLFGVALGVKWAAVRTAPELPQPEFGRSALAAELSAVYNGLMTEALVAAGVLLALGIIITLREELAQNLSEDLERLAKHTPLEEE